jgi:hypothetical protein
VFSPDDPAIARIIGIGYQDDMTMSVLPDDDVPGDGAKRAKHYDLDTASIIRFQRRIVTRLLARKHCHSTHRTPTS